MNPHLCIDLGNSRVKLAVFDGHRLHGFASFGYEEHKNISEWLIGNSFNSIAYASVLQSIPEWCISLLKSYPHLKINSSVKLPVNLDFYLTPETLGADRIAALSGAMLMQLSKPCLVVNAGTCTTYDLLSAAGKFLGGNISPGFEMRLKAMHEFTSNLPLVHPQIPVDSILGNSTMSALEHGAHIGQCLEIEGYFLRLQENYPGLICVLTGGNAHMLSNQLKISTFADPYLVLKGINYILELNEIK